MTYLGAALLATALLASSAFADARVDYILHCRGCHGPEGNGLPDGAPSFRGHVARFLWVPGGREYLVGVPGVAQSELSDARLAEVVNWIVREFSAAELPPDFLPFTADEIALHRRPPLSDVAGVRRELLRAIAARAPGDVARGAVP